jgi:chaperone required for assembly of F1-ATPase
LFTPHEHNTPHEHYYPLTAKNQNSNLIRDVIINRPKQPYMQTKQWTTQSSAALFVTPEAELTGEQVGMTKTPVNNNLMSTNAPFSLMVLVNFLSPRDTVDFRG